jgi:hypothetical protein
VLEVITGTGAAHVTVLPIDRGLIGIADEAAIRAVAGRPGRGGGAVLVAGAGAGRGRGARPAPAGRRRRGADGEAAAATRRGEVVIARRGRDHLDRPVHGGDVARLRRRRGRGDRARPGFGGRAWTW